MQISWLALYEYTQWSRCTEGDTLSMTDVLDQIFESVCKPLEVRIDSVLNSVPAPLTCYKLSQVCCALLSLSPCAS